MLAADNATRSASAPNENAESLLQLIAAKGSVTLDGVSLTVNAVTDGSFSVLIIPHTLQATTFGALRPGDIVNLEVDTMARYAARLAQLR